MTFAWWLVVLLACGGGEGDAPTSVPIQTVDEAAKGHFVRTTQAGRYIVDMQLDPPMPELGQLFAIDAVVTRRDGLPLEVGSLALDARMPQHDHGMETKPQLLPGACEGDVCTHPGGRYRTEGFKFHMVGEWTVTIDVQGLKGPDSTSMVYELL